ncbi:MAG: acyl-CoA dehydrogenase [Alphaproteobacteria bacterium]|nr:acyl-CoA dehydrogenase [Alphaproteobacteria bacterium]
MADDTMTEERRLIQAAAREFARREVLPVANRLDRVQGEMPMELRDKLAANGYFGILIPQAFGGLGLGKFEYCLVAEELARGWMSVASIIARTNNFVESGLTDAQAARWLPRMARGDFIAASAISEPEAGSDVANISCRAELQGDAWVITGAKTWCTFADGADGIAVVCRTDPVVDPKRRHLGLTTLMVEKPRGSFPPGLTGSPIDKIGYFGWKTWQLFFDGVRVPVDAVVGEVGKAFYATGRRLATARVHTAARAVGLAQGALEDSISYAAERRQFNQPIGAFQSIRFMLADMATKVEAARQLTRFAANELDQGRRADQETSMAKYFASEIAEEVTSAALQIHGGYGYTRDFAVERYWRDARLTKIFEGTSQIQLRIVSDRLLGRTP